MPAGSGITLRNSAEADIPTPGTDQVTIFADADAANEPAYKDEAGTVTSLRGAAGTAGADGADAPPLTYSDHGNTGATETVDASAADIHRLVADSATVTLTLTGWPAAGTPSVIRLWLEQDATGGRVWSFPAAVTWGDAGEPDWSTRSASAIDLVDLQTVDGGTTVVASLAGRPGPAGADGADGTMDVQEGASSVVATASALNFDASDFDITDEGAGVAGIALAASAGGSGSILDQLLANAAVGDPGLDAAVSTGSTAGSLVALGYFASVASTTFQDQASSYTVPVGRTLIIVQLFAGKDIENNFRKVRLRNTTDSTTPIQGDFANVANMGGMLPYYKDGTGDWQTKIAAGKTIKLGIATADTTRRSTGGVVIGVLV